MTAVLKSRTTGPYSFSSQPKVIPNKRKFREIPSCQVLEAEGFNHYNNLMFDRRVIRGNTYALHLYPPPENEKLSAAELKEKACRQRQAKARREAKKAFFPKSPCSLEGRLYKEIQTELYLEELNECVEEDDAQCQTDTFLDRPPTPLYVPAKTGTDASTNIGEGDLFDFDLEVTPLLELLVGKTVEQAILEVMEEEELQGIRAQQLAFEELRQAELAEVQRLMEKDRRIREEKERRKANNIVTTARQQELADKVAARAFVKAFLSDLEPNVFDNLAEHGYFYDPVERDVETGFLPWLVGHVNEELELEDRSRFLLDTMIREVVCERFHDYRRLEELELEQRLHATAGDAISGDPDDDQTAGQTWESKQIDDDLEPMMDNSRELGNVEEDAEVTEVIEEDDEEQGGDSLTENVTAEPTED